MNNPPSPVGGLSLLEDLEQMDKFHELPDSALVSLDMLDVFVSFHWECSSRLDAVRLSAELTAWLREFLASQGAEEVIEVDGGLNG
jgi:hypothetical protein